MSGAVIAYKNLVDDLVVGSTFTADGGTFPDFPISNLQLRTLSKVCRLSTAGPPVARLNLDLGKVRDVRIVALLAIGLGARALGGSDVLLSYSRDNSTWYSAVFSIANDTGVPELPSGAVFVPTRPPTDVTPPGGPAGTPGIVARYLRIQPNWSSGAASYREFGRLWVGDALVIPEGVEASWQEGAIDPGAVDVADGGQAYENPKTRLRTLQCSLPKMTSVEAYGFDESASSATDAPCIQGLQMRCGSSGEVLVLPRSSNPLWIRRLGIHGRCAEVPAIRSLKGPYYATDFRLVEER
jgi:hypothetical protein